MTDTAPAAPQEASYDLIVIGGGINGTGIARDAAGRGLSVLLVEQGDLAGATSSASTKLFHGGLRYLEYFEFRLVREALREREVLLRNSPHISWPMRFVLPLSPGMRFDAETPTSRLLSRILPWMKGRRPDWIIRLGLALYDGLAGRSLLPGTARLDLAGSPEGAPLRDRYRHAFEYSDGWVQDARLVALNARDAAARGAVIRTRTRLVAAEAGEGRWTVGLRDMVSGAETQASARLLVNAAGPWVAELMQGTLGSTAPARVRLVRGSHIVTRRLYDHDKCYFFQGRDGRIIFAIPYEEEFTLIGTTDAAHPDAGTAPVCTEAERDYLLKFASEYFARPVTAEDVVWTYSGVRPLYDDGAKSATAATRDYVLNLEDSAGAPLLNVFGGKITTYRRLAEHALDKIAGHFPGLGPAWTDAAPLPGGDFEMGGQARLVADLLAAYPFLAAATARRLVRAYGTEAATMLDGAGSAADLGHDFGAGLCAREAEWLIAREFALTGEDVLWRRSKLGLHMSPEERATFSAWMAARTGVPG